LLDDQGTPRKAFHGTASTGMQEMPLTDGAALASAEKSFWLQWAADDGHIASSNS
jgi:hypothetical protein